MSCTLCGVLSTALGLSTQIETTEVSLWLFIRGLPFLMKNISAALKLLLCLSVLGQWILAAPKQKKLRCSSELSLPVENAVQESVTAVTAVITFSCWLDLKKGIYLLPTQNFPLEQHPGVQAGECCLWLWGRSRRVFAGCLPYRKQASALCQSSWAQSWVWFL